MCPFTDDMIFVVEWEASNSAIWHGSLETSQLELDIMEIPGRLVVSVNYNPADNTVYWTEVDEITYTGSIQRMVIGSGTIETVIPSITSPNPIIC